MPSFNEMLIAMEQAEEGLIALDQEEMKDLVGDIRDKTDAIHEVLQRMEYEENRLAENIKKLQDRKKQIKEAQKRLKDYVIYCLERSDMPAVYGKVWDLKIVKRKITGIRPITDDDARKHQDLIEFSWKWDRSKVLEKAKEGHEVAKSLVEESETRYLSFSAHKGKS